MLRNNVSLLMKGRRLSGKADPMWAIPISLLIGSILTVYPLPHFLLAWRPDFMLLLVLFWVLLQPAWCGVWFTFFVGVLTDLLLDNIIGLHAFLFVVLLYAVRFLTRNKRMLTFFNLWGIAALVTFVYMVLYFLGQRLAGNVLPLWYWASLLPSILIWPVLYAILQRWRGV